MKRLITLIVFFLMLMMAIGGMIAEAQNYTNTLSLKDRQKIENKFSSFIASRKFSGADRKSVV